MVPGVGGAGRLETVGPQTGVEWDRAGRICSNCSLSCRLDLTCAAALLIESNISDGSAAQQLLLPPPLVRPATRGQEPGHLHLESTVQWWSSMHYSGDIYFRFA